MASGDLPAEPVSGQHPAWDPRSYPAQSVPERMAIISAGVIMNVIFAVIMASWAFGLGVRELTCTVSSVRSGGAAWRAGLRTGDEIVAINGRRNPIFNDLKHGLTVGSVAQGTEFTVRRPDDDSTRTVVLKPDTDLGAPTIGVTSPVSLTVPAAVADKLPGAARRAEPALQGGDTIKAVNGAALATYAELIAALSRERDKPVTLTVSRTPAAPAGATPATVEVQLPPQRRT
jgi:regulator of sigma E protease